jgi:hypothetical protein
MKDGSDSASRIGVPDFRRGRGRPLLGAAPAAGLLWRDRDVTRFTLHLDGLAGLVGGGLDRDYCAPVGGVEGVRT